MNFLEFKREKLFVRFLKGKKKFREELSSNDFKTLFEARLKSFHGKLFVFPNFVGTYPRIYF